MDQDWNEIARGAVMIETAKPIWHLEDLKPIWRWKRRDTWPDLRATIRPFPWTWEFKPTFFVDDVHGWSWGSLIKFRWLFLEVELWT